MLIRATRHLLRRRRGGSPPFCGRRERWIARRPARLGQALDRLAASSDMVVLDLTAAHMADPGALARNLVASAGELDRPRRCLLLVGAPSELVAELDRAASRLPCSPPVD